MPRRAFPALIVAALLLAGCSAKADSGSCSYDTQTDGVTVTGQAGEQPEITLQEGAQPPDSLVALDLCPGDGEAATATSTLTVDYVGMAWSTGEVFDSSFVGGGPAQFPLANVVAGWQQGLQGMQVGGTRLLIIPPDLAYGSAGRPPVIAGDETLVFVVDLIEVQ